MSDLVEIQNAPLAMIRMRGSAFLELTKPRIASMVVVVTGLGFYLALPAEVGASAGASLLSLLASALAGTALLGAGANALNQHVEADLDAKMRRTEGRPIPSGRLSRTEALLFAVTISLVGAALLAWQVNVLTSVIGVGSLLSYTFIYTPLKQRSPLSVYVGAVSGALPPVMGWTAVTGDLTLFPVLLFGILFFWQLPHFASIAWIYRDDYSQAGYQVLPVVDPAGRLNNRHLLVYSVVLLVVSLFPALMGLAGAAYGVGAAMLGVAFLLFGWSSVCRMTRSAARLHVIASVIYLPLLLSLMIVDKVATH